MSTPNKYVVNVNKIKQLVDLNKHYTNFNLRFKAVSQNQEDFYAAVVDQTTIDNLPDTEIQYKLANGSISGNVSSDKNVYQNHFLILKSENPITVEVEIELKELPNTQKHDVSQNTQGMQQSMKQSMKQSMQQGRCPIENNLNGVEKSSLFNRRNLFILLGLFFIGILVYFFIKSKTQSNKDELLIPTLSRESLQKQLYQPHLPKLSLPSRSIASSASKSSISSRVSSARSSKSSSSQSSLSSKLSARSAVNPNLIEKLKSISLG